MQIAKLDKITADYDGDVVLENVSIEVQKGDFIALLGRNGSGKTTLLKVMLGLLKPKSGKASLFNKDISQFKEWEKVGYLPQNASFFEKNFPATVREVVSTGLYAKAGLFKNLSREDWNKVDYAIETVGLSKHAEKQVSELSGGQQQKAFIAKAISPDPELFILDEPTTSLDEESETEFYSLLESLNKKGVTVIIVSHDIGLVSEKVRTVLCIDRQVVYHGDSSTFRKKFQEKPEAFFGPHARIAHHHH